MIDGVISGFEAGHFTLPAEVVTAYEAERTISAVLDSQPSGSEAVEDARRRFREAVLKAATAGKTLPDGAALVKAKAVAETQDEALEVVRGAVRQAERHSKTTFAQSQSEILLTHLRPAFEDVIAKARDATEDELPDLRLRYGSIRGARSSLHLLVPKLDQFGVFTELRDLDVWWPQFYRERVQQQVRGMVIPSPQEMKELESARPPQFTPAPWPSEALPRFRWIIDNCEPWLPSPEQQDARFEEFLAQARAEHGERSRQWREEHWAVR